MNRISNRWLILAASGALLCTFGCAQSPAPKVVAKPQEPLKPTPPPEMTQAAQAALGTEAEVLAFGDLSGAGHPQVLAVNRLQKAPTGAVPGTLITRAAVVENDGGKWKEVFLADEHLKNPNGYLGATPISPVPAWRLQFEQHVDKGLVLYFTPLQAPAGGYITTIGIRWNPQVKRYQSLDRNFEHFLTEVPSLGTVEFQLHR